jgi:hypothetical protein
MFGDLSKILIKPIVSRAVLGFLILSLSSIAMAIHFKLGNSFSIIQDWFRVYLIEIAAISAFIQFLIRIYLGWETFLRVGSKKEDNLLLINYFTIFFFIVFVLGVRDFYSFIREALFYTSFFVLDFFNNYKQNSLISSSLRLKIFKFLFESSLSCLMFFIFFGGNKEFSYCFILFYLGLSLSCSLFFGDRIKTVKYYAVIIFFLILSMKQNIFFPENQNLIIISTLTFFGFNLITFTWHRYSKTRQIKKGIWRTN